MNATVIKCPLCGTPGALCQAADYGNRQHVVCRTGNCGEYVMTNHAVRRVKEGGPNREVLAEMVRQANSRSRLLDISVGGDGLIVASEVAPREKGV